MRDGAAQFIVLFGCGLVCLAGIGVVRFGEALARLHALTKASALGLLLVLVGAAVGASSAYEATSLVMAAILQLMTLPIGANLIARAAYRVARMDRGPAVDSVDELQEIEERGSIGDDLAP